MKRKIVKLGTATFVTSLPSKWVREHSLKQGDYLEVEPKGKQLVISTDKVTDFKSIVVELPLKKRFMKRLVHAPYCAGYDEIKFIYDDPSLIKSIQEPAKILMGFDIVDQGENYCIFRNIASSFEAEFDNIFKRAFMVIQSLLDDCVDALDKKEFSRFENLPETDQLIDKLTFFCERVLNRRGNSPANTFKYVTVWSLEQIGDDIKDCCTALEGMTNISDKTLDRFRKVRSFFKDFFNFYFKPDLDGMHSLDRKYQELSKDLLYALVNSPKEEVRVIYYLLNIVDKTRNIALSLRLS